MNWDAVGAIGEIVGAAAVVVSVIYLALQVKKQAEESRLAATRELAEQNQKVLDALIADPKLTSMFGKAVQSYSVLPNDDRLWASLLFQRAFRVMEQQLLHTKNANMEKDYFESFERTFFEVLTYPGIQEWWIGSSELFSDSFKNYVNANLDAAKAKGYNSSFKTTDN